MPAYPSPTPEISTLTTRLLDQLQAEERLLHTTRESVLSLYTALRKGHLPSVQNILTLQQWNTEQVRTQAESRERAADELANALGMSSDSELPSLKDLASRVPEPHASRLLEARTRMKELTGQIEHFQLANANLLDRLRSYFGDVLADLQPADAPMRYGPAGHRLSTPTVPAIVASG